MGLDLEPRPSRLSSRVYRERAEGDPDDQLVVCPSCQTPVEPASAVDAVCPQCNQRFAVRTAQSLREVRALRTLAKAMVPAPRDREWLTPARRWALTGVVFGVIVGATALFGVIGCAVTLGALLAVAARGDPYR